MSNPVKNNQVPPPANDPYSKSYGDPYGNNYGSGGYDPGMGENPAPSGDMSTDSYAGYENGDYGDYGDFSGDFFGGEDDFGLEGEGPSAPQGGYTEPSVRQMLRDMQGTLSEAEFRALQGRINATAAMSPQQAQAELARIANDLYVAANPEIAGPNGEFGEGQELSPEQEVRAEIEKFLEGVNANPDLSSSQKSEYKEKLDKLLNGLSLGTIDADTALERFQDLRQEISDATAFPPIFQTLGEVTGKSPQELEALFKKHGLDPKNLPNPPDSAVAALLNDPEFSSSLQQKRNDLKDAQKALKDKIDAKIAECNTRNDAARANTSVTNDNFQPFRDIQDIYEHKDDLSIAMLAARKELATEAAKILSAMYGTNVTALSDDAKAGGISFNGTEMNVAANSSLGNISFSTDTSVDWPEFTRPTFWKDCEGSGAIAAPGWMQQAGYPAASYDGKFEWHRSS